MGSVAYFTVNLTAKFECGFGTARPVPQNAKFDLVKFSARKIEK
ncbi:hypothetical protein [uncultured Campylobacter sp.]|nr:hypothetical protein [uncultured Campylobacter sp.]